MKLKPFKELLTMSKEKIDEALAPIRAKKMKAKVEGKQADIEEEMLTRQEKVFEMCTDSSIDLDKLTEEMDNIALLERRKLQLSSVVAELFPDEVEA